MTTTTNEAIVVRRKARRKDSESGNNPRVPIRMVYLLYPARRRPGGFYHLKKKFKQMKILLDFLKYFYILLDSYITTILNSISRKVY